MRNILIALTLIVVFIAGGVTVNQYLRPVAAAQDGEVVVPASPEPAVVEVIEKNDDDNEVVPDSSVSHKSFGGNVEYTVTNIDNGVVLEMTSTDAEVVQMIQEHKAKKQEHMANKDHMGKWYGSKSGSNLTKNIENIDNGVRVTITSDDPDAVQQLQEHKAGGMKHGNGKQHGGYWGAGKHMKGMSES